MEETFRNFIGDHWLNIVLILLAAYLARKFAMTLIGRLVRRAIRADNYKTMADEIAREKTLLAIISAALRVGIWVIAGLLILGEAGINIAPLLAGAGVAGVALGFGAQSMVKDFLAGFFIIIENQYRVGDVVQVNQGVAGIVEHLTLRATVLRDLDGMVHHIPNGNIEIATNMTMEFANINLDVRVDYSTDLDKAEDVINRTGAELTKDKDWQDKIIEAPKVLRVNEFDDTGIVIKIIGKTVPMEQWAITGELRKRLKKAFDKAGITIPLPQRIIREAERPK